jgi:hypothetical protein
MRQYLQVVSSKDICSVALNGASLGRARTTNGSDRGKHDLTLIVRRHRTIECGRLNFQLELAYCSTEPDALFNFENNAAVPNEKAVRLISDITAVRILSV